MMNTFMNTLSDMTDFGYTENGALTHRQTGSKVYDMFAFGAAYRQRSDEDCILLFKNAYEEDKNLALKCLFYIRDVRGGGQGERRFFRVCYNWLAKNDPSVARKLIGQVPEFGRYDDLYCVFDTPVEKSAMELIKQQLMTDMASKENGISLIAKWCPSENASSVETKAKAKKIRTYLGITSKQYRKMLSKLREKIKVLERLMSANRWEEIKFDQIPSKAGLKYKNAFARRDIIAKKYEVFAKDTSTKVNAGTLYPYEVVAKAVQKNGWSWYGYNFSNLSDVDRAMINKYWDNLPDYLNGSNSHMMCIIDTSGSMTGDKADAPLNVAISLGMYCAEHMGKDNPFRNHYISFSSRPQFISIEGVDFVDKVRRIYQTNLCEDTNLEAAFNLLLKAATRPGVKKKDIPTTIVVVSDMEINSGCRSWNEYNIETEMETMRRKWASYGVKMPKLVYWNVNARYNNILDKGPDVSFVSGMSPTIFKQVLTGKTGYDLMIETICADRYNSIHI